MKYLKNEEEARDCVQQVFLKAITEIPKYRIDFFKAWIYMVAKNHCLMKLRERHGKKEIELQETHDTSTQNDESWNLQMDKEHQLDEMNNAINQLSNDQKQCIILFYLEKKSYQEVALETGFSLMQVKSNIQNGKRNLRIMLQKKLKNV